MFCRFAKSTIRRIGEMANHYFPGNDLIQDDEKLQPFADEKIFASILRPTPSAYRMVYKRVRQYFSEDVVSIFAFLQI
jgi:hypothetical protein